MANTSRFRALLTSWKTATTVYGFSGSWKAARYVYVRHNDAWVGVYTSEMSASMNSNIAVTGEDASPSGTPSASGGVTGVSGYFGTPAYSWARISGDQGIHCNSAGIAQPTWSRSFSGVPNGTTSSSVAETWRCTITDGGIGSGATIARDYQIEFAWKNTIPAYSGSTDKLVPGDNGSITAPVGASSVTIYVIASGGQGGSGYNDGLDTQYGGGGGGSSGRAVHVMAVTGGVTSFSYSVGGLFSNSSVGGAASLSATRGGNGTGASSGGAGGGGGGGTASGGNSSNDPGTSGNSGSLSSGGSGAGGQSAPDGTYGYGGNGTDSIGTGGSSPGGGVIFFVWSP